MNLRDIVCAGKWEKKIVEVDKQIEDKEIVFPHPKKGILQALPITLLLEGENYHSREDNLGSTL